MEKIISLDIETSNLSMKAENLEFSNPAKWKISCVGVYDAHKYEEHFYVLDDDIVEVINSKDNPFRINVKPIKDLSKDLQEWFNQGYSLLTHNGTGFDIPILKKSIEDGGASCKDVFETDFNHYDMSYTLKKMTGERYRLQSLVKAMLGEGKSKLMDAKFAPSEWHNKNYSYVLEYCILDCKLTYEVFTESAKQGEIRAINEYHLRPVSFEDFLKYREGLK